MMTAEIPQRPRTLVDLATVLRERPSVIDARAHADVYDYAEIEVNCGGVPPEIAQEISAAGFWIGPVVSRLADDGDGDGERTIVIVRDREVDR